MKIIAYLLSFFLLVGCATHQSYDSASFRQRDIGNQDVALSKNGLSREQIDIISSTKPPVSYPIDVSIVVLSDRYISSRAQHIFTYELVQSLKRIDKIERVTLLPKFIIPQKVDFNALQELGVRSLSEYIIVFDLNSKEFFNWTKIFESEFEISSSISYIIVDSFTSAMMTADKLHSTQTYRESLFSSQGERKAQKIIFSEQARLLAQSIKELLK